MKKPVKPVKPELPKEVTEGFEPGSFGFHEMLDRTGLMAELFSGSIAEHPAAQHPKLAKRIERIEQQLFDLYQVAGGLHV